MTAAADAMVSRKRGGVSLLDVGYEHIGLDDYWQACGTGVSGSFHNASGYPLVNTTLFPDFKAMNDHAHAVGLSTGWYGNNCHCGEGEVNVTAWGASPGGKGKTDSTKHYQGDVRAIIDFGFKLDNCGQFLNMSLFAELMNATGRPVLVEECHWGGGAPGTWGDGGQLNRGPNEVPAAKWCPYNFFRTSNDIQAEWSSVFKNLQSVAPHQPWLRSAGEVVTGPGCFAYPDSLEVGNLKSYAKDGSKNMSQFRMHRSNFGAWCVVSSPLILGHDLTDDLVMDKIWPIITNRHAINISQSFGDSLHPGVLVRTWSPSDSPSEAPNTTTQFVWALNDDPATTGGWTAAVGTAGPVRHRSVGADVDLCLTVPVAGRQKGKVSLSGCVTPMQPNQTWLYETNGSFLIHPAWQEPTKGSKKAQLPRSYVPRAGKRAGAFGRAISVQARRQREVFVHRWQRLVVQCNHRPSRDAPNQEVPVSTQRRARRQLW